MSDFTKITWLVDTRTQIRIANPFALAAVLPDVNKEDVVPTDTIRSRP